MADLKALSRRKYLTGKELGILEVENLCVIARENRDGKNYEPVIKDRDKFINKLRLLNIYERSKYDDYIQLHHWLIEESREINYTLILAEYEVYMLMTQVEGYQAREEGRQFMEKYELTEEQAEDFPECCESGPRLEDLIDPDGNYTEDGRKIIETNKGLRKNVIDAVYKIRGYNYTLERIAALLDVSGAVYFQTDASLLYTQLEAYPRDVLSLVNHIKKGADVEDNKHKLKLIRALYKPIREEDIGELDEDAKARIDPLISSFKGLYGQPPVSDYYEKR